MTSTTWRHDVEAGLPNMVQSALEWNTCLGALDTFNDTHVRKDVCQSISQYIYVGTSVNYEL